MARNNLPHNTRALLQLSVDMAHDRCSVDKHIIAERYDVHPRTALRWLQALYEADLVECAEERSSRDARLSMWAASYSLKKMLGQIKEL